MGSIHESRLTLLVLIVLGMISTAVAQEFPARPVRMVIPFPAGGSIDIVAPAKTPKAAIAKLQQTLAATLANQELRDQLATREDSEAIGSTPEAFAKLMRSEYDRWGKMIRMLGVKGE